MDGELREQLFALLPCGGEDGGKETRTNVGQKNEQGDRGDEEIQEEKIRWEEIERGGRKQNKADNGVDKGSERQLKADKMEEAWRGGKETAKINVVK